jgi:hypothetical protein
MLSLFTKKSFPVAELPPKHRQKLLASEWPDEEIIRFLNEALNVKRPIVSTLLLVALEEFPARYAIFKRSMSKSHQYSVSMDGMITFSYDMFSQYHGDDLDSALVSRQWYFLHVAGLLTIAQERAVNNPLLWQSIAEIWVRLIRAAKDLRTVLSNTRIWNTDELFFFNINEEDDEDIIAYVENALLPAELRGHPLLLEWERRKVMRHRAKTGTLFSHAY